MYAAIRDLDLYYEVYGQGMPVILVHGMGVDHRVMTGCMEPVFQATEEAWKRVYLDLPGMGRTKGADWIANSDDMLSVVLQFIDGIIPGERFLVVGESYGGYLARAIVRERMRDVEGLLLIAPLVVPDDAKRDLPPCSVLRREKALVEALEPEERQMLDSFVVDQTERTWIRFRDEMLSGAATGDQAFRARIRTDIEAYALSYDVDEPPELFGRPSLIISGRQDCLAGYRDSWSLLDNYPRSTFAVLDMAGHAVQIEQAGLFSALVQEWLDRVMACRPATPSSGGG